MKERVDQLTTVSEYIGTYFSVEWVRKNVLKQTDETIEEIDKQIADEKSAGTIAKDAGTELGGPEGGFGEPTGQFDDEDEDDDFPDADDGNGNGNGNGSENRNL